ncbi:MAG: DUF4157 domain-containing protein [Proteobacteria bacterium]|nr:DUF4157 domain-containing protein [Pseudomonadota bacterium]
MAARGVDGSGESLPYLDTLQDAFGPDHDLGGVNAHIGGAAAAACDEMGAEAYATSNRVAFKSTPTLHTAAHEAAHVVQQRASVQLKGGVGEAGDAYERHANAIGDRVVAGQSIRELLAPFTPAGASHAGQEQASLSRSFPGGPVQRQESESSSNEETGGESAGDPEQGDIGRVRAEIAKAKAILEDESVPLTEQEREELAKTIHQAEADLRDYVDLANQGSTQKAGIGGLLAVGGAILADDATGVGVADDPLLILVGIGLAATWLFTRSPASSRELARSWQSLICSLEAIAAASTTVLALRIKGDQLRGNTERLAEHLARLLAVASVGGVPSGEPPSNNNDNDPHWWKEIKAFLKNIQSSIKGASRKQVMRELLRKGKFTEQQIRDIANKLVEAANKMGEPPPPFLP